MTRRVGSVYRPDRTQLGERSGVSLGVDCRRHHPSIAPLIAAICPSAAILVAWAPRQRPPGHGTS